MRCGLRTYWTEWSRKINSAEIGLRINKAHKRYGKSSNGKPFIEYIFLLFILESYNLGNAFEYCICRHSDMESNSLFCLFERFCHSERVAFFCGLCRNGNYYFVYGSFKWIYWLKNSCFVIWEVMERQNPIHVQKNNQK